MTAIVDLSLRLAGRKPDLTADLLVAAAAIGLAASGRLIVDIFAPGWRLTPSSFPSSFLPASLPACGLA
ncbi:MAG: hypothetical protein ACOY5R_10545 [Pseudomonadota bacterium]